MKHTSVVWINKRNPIAKGCLSCENTRVEINNKTFIVDCIIYLSKNSLNKILILEINDETYIFFLINSFKRRFLIFDLQDQYFY